MTPTPFIHHFKCDCGRQSRTLTGLIYDCPCGRSRQYFATADKHRVIHFIQKHALLWVASSEGKLLQLYDRPPAVRP